MALSNAIKSAIGVLVLGVLAGLLAGCAHVPPAPPGAVQKTPPADGKDPYEGWLFDRVTGRQQAAAQPTAPPNPGAPGGPQGMTPPVVSGVVPVSATEPLPPGANGPGPALPAPLPATPGPAAPPGTPVVVSPPTGKEKENTGFDWSDLSPENSWKRVKKLFGYGPEERLARTAFQEGEALFREKKYAEAATKFYTASWRWPDSTLEEDAMFLLGECYFFTDQYGKSHDTYTNLLKQHSNTRYLDTVMHREFAIGRYWDELDVKQSQWPTTPNLTDKTRPWFDTFGNALAAYEAVRMHDPTGPLADASIMATANAYFRKSRWEEAAYHYDLLRKEPLYARSRFQKEAHIFGLQAKLQMYQGAMYDEAPLVGAKEIAESALTQYHGRLGEEENHIRQSRSRIIEQLAEREWTLAQYYDRKHYYGAARLSYRALVQKYPTTQLAEQARQRMEQIKNEPDEPPQRFKWLAQILSRDEVR
jgi:TolA-binding protein